MNSTLTAYAAMMCTSGVLNLYLCWYVFSKRHRYNNIAAFFMFYTAVIAVYCFAAAVSLLSTTIEQLMFWTIVQYVGIAFSSPLGLLFVMQYLGIKTTKNSRRAILLVPFLTLLMVATNDWHHFHYRVFTFDPELGAPYLHLEIGLWYVVHGVYIFSCMFIAFLLIMSQWKETAGVYRPQLIALLCGQLVPMLTSFLYLVGVTPQGIDPVPIVLWLSSLLYLWAIGTSRLFTVMPIAKDAIFNSISDGVMVLDESHRLVEFNQASKKYFSSLNKSMYGMEFDKIWPTLTGEELPLLIETAVGSQEIHIAAGHSDRIYQVRISSLKQAENCKGLLIIFTDITELKRLQAKLEQHAYYDELTGIYNRRAFFQNCEQDFTAAKKNSAEFAVMLLDIDHFKKVNDTYGHQTGDRLLIHFVTVCQTQLKEGQFFARYGGEEFVVVLNGYSAVEAEMLGDQLRREVENQHLVTAEGNISVTLSVGVAAAENDAEETLYQLLDKADKGLYYAKQEGRNQVRVYAKDQAAMNSTG